PGSPRSPAESRRHAECRHDARSRRHRSHLPPPVVAALRRRSRHAGRRRAWSASREAAARPAAEIARVKNRPKHRKRSRRRASRRSGKAIAAAPVTAAELRALRDEINRRMRTAAPAVVGKQRPRAAGGRAAARRWNPHPEDVQRSVAQLVLTIVEFLRRLMERQAIRRMEQKTLTRKEVEAVGEALMKLEETVRDIGRKFGLSPEDLNLDAGPLGKLM